MTEKEQFRAVGYGDYSKNVLLGMNTPSDSRSRISDTNRLVLTGLSRINMSCCSLSGERGVGVSSGFGSLKQSFFYEIAISLNSHGLAR